jgi:hypothetical protein
VLNSQQNLDLNLRFKNKKEKKTKKEKEKGKKEKLKTLHGLKLPQSAHLTETPLCDPAGDSARRHEGPGHQSYADADWWDPSCPSHERSLQVFPNTDKASPPTRQQLHVLPCADASLSCGPELSVVPSPASRAWRAATTDAPRTPDSS